MKKSFLILLFLLISFSNYAQIDFQLLWTGFTDWDYFVSFSPDGNNVLSYDGNNNTLKVYDANTGGQVWVKQNVSNCSFSPDGSKVIGISSQDLCVYDRYSGSPIWIDTLSGGSYIVSPNSNFILVRTSYDTTKLFNLNTGNIIWVKNHCEPLNISFDNTIFSYYAGNNDSIIVSNLISGNQLWSMNANGYDYLYSGFSPDNNFYATTSYGGGFGSNGIKIFNSNTGAYSSIITNAGRFLQYSADSLKIYSLSGDELFVFNSTTHILSCVVSNNWFVPDSPTGPKLYDCLNNVVACARDESSGFAVFNTNNGLLIGSDNVSQQFSLPTNYIQVTSLALSPDGTKIFTAEEESSGLPTVKMWSTGISGISNNESKNSFYKIYPVPVVQNLSIEIQNEKIVERIEIFDLQGRLLRSISSNEKKYNLDVHSLISGTYLLKIIFADGNIDLEKIIKE